MPTIECPHCQTGYPDILSACPSCGKAEKADKAEKPDQGKPSVDLKKLVPFIVITDLLVLAVILFVFFLRK